MTNVLITGRNSYLGNSIEAWLKQKGGFHITKISLKESSWKTLDFSPYDVCIHVAGIAHASKHMKDSDIYDQVNHVLTKEVAVKAKEEGIQHFIFLSSMIVYNPQQSQIHASMEPEPKGSYALSKYRAENALNSIEDERFKVAILRPAMIYGSNSIGNFPKLVTLVKNIPVFPRLNNLRSFLYIDSFTEAVYQVIQNLSSGTFHLADRPALSTTDLVTYIAEGLTKKMYFTRLFNPLIQLLKPFNESVSKLFSTYMYEESLITQPFKYHVKKTQHAVQSIFNKDIQ